MLTSIAISNFKIYQSRTVFDGLSGINVLTGINGRGKSTLLHSMLLPKQSLKDSQWSDSLALNGNCVNLGNTSDVRNDINSRSVPIVFEYTSVEGRLSLEFASDQENAQKLPLLRVNGRDYVKGKYALQNFVPIDIHEGWTSENGMLSRIAYVSAERIGPQLNYPPVPEQDQTDVNGEFTPGILYQHKNDPIDDDSFDALIDLYPGMTPEDRSLNAQVDFWMSQMFGDTSVVSDFIEAANVYVLLFKPHSKVKPTKPTNIGFGYSYVLPIIVAGLTAKEGDILIVENPEAHLHPMAQSVLGKFMAWVAKKRGVQLFIETHSEHILNSLRVLTAQRFITPDYLNILFFDDSYGSSYYAKIDMDEHGRIAQWPEGFFDQEERDLDILV